MTWMPDRGPTLADKVAFLSRAETYGEGPSAVEVIETHMSYVFLTERHVYKVKKPVRYPFLDFSTLGSRRVNCEEEVRLNRRLARNVYIGTVPVTAAAGDLRLDGSGEIVEWLVKMRRLPRHLMLDRAIHEGRAAEQDIARAVRVLSAFYRHTNRIELTAAQYRERLRSATLENRDALTLAVAGPDRPLVERVASAQLDYIDRCADDLDARVQQKRIVEGHGDLRPEHVCLAAEPVFIDCLEFSRDLRIADPADELAYLGMECELLGAPQIGSILFDTYRECTADAPPARLVAFYQAHRSLLRAKLCAWHLEDGVTNSTRVKWLGRAQAYVRFAERCARDSRDRSVLHQLHK